MSTYQLQSRHPFVFQWCFSELLHEQSGHVLLNMQLRFLRGCPRCDGDRTIFYWKRPAEEAICVTVAPYRRSYSLGPSLCEYN